MEIPETRYASTDGYSVAYQRFGEGPRELVVVPGFVSHIELCWEHPPYEQFMRRLSSFAKVTVFDKRGSGLSDPLVEAPSIEQRMDDIRAVMDAAEVEQATIFGMSEGAAMAAVFAATHPERSDALILYGSFARGTACDEYPWGLAEDLWEDAFSGLADVWGQGFSLLSLAPTRLEDETIRPWWERFERAAASPRVALDTLRLDSKIDIRDVLPAVGPPTLMIHRRGDMWPVEGARYMAERIPGARLVELEGEDHWPWISEGGAEDVLEEIEEFLTGTRRRREPDRMLATVLFTDIVGSTEQAAERGDARWRELLDGHERVTRRELERYRGREVKTTGDGFLATFDGPARAVRCASAIAQAVRPLGIEIRAGLHTGECELRNGDIGGMAVHIGARVAGLAGPSEVIVSSTVRDLTVGSDIEFEERGEHELKGVPGEWRLFAARA